MVQRQLIYRRTTYPYRFAQLYKHGVAAYGFPFLEYVVTCAYSWAEQIRTTVTDLLKINHPIMLAGMNVAAGPKLAAAVTNAGGIGVIGGVVRFIKILHWLLKLMVD